MIKDDKNNTDKIICLKLCFIFICLVNVFKTSHGREENGEERRESRGVEGRGGDMVLRMSAFQASSNEILWQKCQNV